MSQTFDLGLSFNFMQKKRVDLVDFFQTKFSTFDTRFPPYECCL